MTGAVTLEPQNIVSTNQTEKDSLLSKTVLKPIPITPVKQSSVSAQGELNTPVKNFIGAEVKEFKSPRRKRYALHTNI